MSPTKPQDFPLLLEVFREGLACGLISKDEIVTWADGIIKNESEPDYFFIELSLSPDTNSVAEILDQYLSWSKSQIPLRVVFGLTYQKLISDKIDLDTAITFTERTPFRETLTSIEYGSIYDFEEYEMCYPDNVEGLKEVVVKFLSRYKEFNLTNYDQWPDINKQADEVLREEKAKANAAYEVFQKKWRKQQVKRKFKQYTLISIIALFYLVVIILNFKTLQEEPTVSKLVDDHEYIFFLDFFVLYSTLRIGYKVWSRRRRMR
jgi:hypothetical protein